jgi:adenosylhomocysteinase
MDMSFANQALSAEFFLKNIGRLENRVYTLPRAIDQQVAALKLQAMEIQFDTLSKEQKHYLGSYNEGT